MSKGRETSCSTYYFPNWALAPWPTFQIKVDYVHTLVILKGG